MVNDIIKTALQQRTRHYHLEHAFGYVLIGVPLFGVNDRGPYIHGRSLDLSKGAADKIGLTSSGVGRVKVTRLN
jgi:hypothetical protein